MNGLAGSIEHGALELAGTGPRIRSQSGRWTAAWSGSPVGLDELLGALVEPVDLAAALRRLRGTFALVLFDAERGEGHVVRDQLGGVELYVAWQGRQLRFGDELGPVLDGLRATPVPDEASIVSWIGSGTLPLGRTLYQGVVRVPPGHLLGSSQPGGTPQAWWTLRAGPSIDLEAGDLARASAEAAAHAVGRVVPSASSAAVLVSGGLDSATVLAAAAAHVNASSEQAPVAYSATFPDHPDVDERHLIDELVDHVGVLSVRSVVRTGDAVSASLRHLSRWRQPSISPNYFIWRPLVRRAADDGHHVLLDGEGGDEVFGAVPLLFADLLRTGRLARAWHLTNRVHGFAARPGAAVRLRLLRHFALEAKGTRSPRPAARRRGRAAREAPAMLSLTAARTFHDVHDPAAWRQLDGPLWNRRLRYALTDERELLDAHGFLRRRAREFGLEGRHPFMHDVDLLEWAVRVPPEALFSPEVDRPALRAGLAGAIPESVRRRTDKSRFNSIAREALSGANQRYAEVVLGPRAEVRRWVPSAWLAEALQATAAGPASDARRELALFRIGALETWLRSLGDASWVDRQLESVRASSDTFEVKEPV